MNHQLRENYYAFTLISFSSSYHFFLNFFIFCWFVSQLLMTRQRNVHQRIWHEHGTDQAGSVLDFPQLQPARFEFPEEARLLLDRRCPPHPAVPLRAQRPRTGSQSEIFPRAEKTANGSRQGLGVTENPATGRDSSAG